MPFVNEYISKEDMEKYKIKEINQLVGPVGFTSATDWTIDKERDIYLRCVTAGREDWANETGWTFYWKGHLLFLRMDMIDSGGKPNAPGWAHRKVVSITNMKRRSTGFPSDLISCKNEIMEDIKKAFEAYRDGGIYSSTTSYSIILDVAEGV